MGRYRRVHSLASGRRISAAPDLRRRSLVFAIAAVPAVAIAMAPPTRSPLSVGEAIAWLHRIGFQSPVRA